MKTRRISRRGLICAGFLACAMMLGGGGSPNPGTEVLLQLVFVAAVVGWIWWLRGEGVVPAALLWLGIAVLAIPMLHLVPLPPVIWHHLPGRELEIATLSLVGKENSWRSLSISPPLTFAGLLAMIPAIGTMWAVSALGRHDRRLLVLVVALVALAGAALGALQMAGGPDAFRLYEKTHRGWLTAFHANRNAAVDVLLIGSLALTAFYATAGDRTMRRHRAFVFLSAQLVLLVAVLMTGSRAGIALLLVALTIHWAILRRSGELLPVKWVIGGLAGVAAALLALPFVAGANSRLSRVVQRFDATGDARFPLWEDTWTAVQGFGWAGSGIGTFTNAFLPYESFTYLDPASPNRAHNDYLEFLLEAGVLAPIILLAALGVLAHVARTAVRLSPGDHALRLFAVGVLAIVALHSIVDYPLRNMAIACLFAAAVGLLSPIPGETRGRTGRDGKK